MRDAISNIDAVTRPQDGFEERVLSNHNLQKRKGASSLKAKPPHLSPRLCFSLRPRIFARCSFPLPTQYKYKHREQKIGEYFVFKWVLGETWCARVLPLNFGQSSQRCLWLTSHPTGDGVVGPGPLLEGMRL